MNRRKFFLAAVAAPFVAAASAFRRRRRIVVDELHQHSNDITKLFGAPPSRRELLRFRIGVDYAGGEEYTAVVPYRRARLIFEEAYKMAASRGIAI